MGPAIVDEGTENLIGVPEMKNLRTKRQTKLRSLTFILLIVGAVPLSGQLKLPRLISDGVVLQRNAPVTVWGWASQNRSVSVRFVDSTYSATADSAGAWNIVLAPMNAGGPYELTAIAGDTITIHDVMMGDVWVCSGQSNMELPMSRVTPLYGKEIADSRNENIRQFYVPQRYDFNKPREDFESGSWKSANPQNVPDFSAVAYFFGKALYDRYKVPIGLINTSLGGSPAQSWMSEEALKAFPEYYKEAQRFKDSSLIRQIEDGDRRRIAAWYALLQKRDEGYRIPGKPWYSPPLNTSRWSTMDVPGYWSKTRLGPVNGVVWFKREFRVPASAVGKEATLNLGRIVDADSVFVNGTFVGTTSYQYPPRWYIIPSGILKPGKNTIVARVISNIGIGGFVPDKPYEVVVANDTIDLRGRWQYRLGARMDPLASQTFVRWKPLGLYNAMLAPLLNHRIKGVIWYQGESNAADPLEYRVLFPAMIRDWRVHWHQGDFPFLFVQLPNFMEARKEPSESNWALLREAQFKTLSVMNTGMAVTIDVGEWNDIHPLDKKDVGDRLALGAERIAYGDANVVYSGPLYNSMSVEGSKIAIRFTCIGSGLTAKDGDQLQGFAVAGPDRRFAWAKAAIVRDQVLVWSESIPHPVAVRYAWADNPAGANLYNVEGLPASPFRTDDW